MTFKKPSQTQGDRKTNVGMGDLADQSALVVLRFIENKPEITTVNGVSDAVAVDLLIVDGAHAGTFEEDRLIFNVGVRNVVEGSEKGDLIAGRIVWKTTRTGRKAAVLEDASDADTDKAVAAWDALQKKGAPAPF